MFSMVHISLSVRNIAVSMTIHLYPMTLYNTEIIDVYRLLFKRVFVHAAVKNVLLSAKEWLHQE